MDAYKSKRKHELVSTTEQNGGTGETGKREMLTIDTVQEGLKEPERLLSTRCHSHVYHEGDCSFTSF